MNPTTQSTGVIRLVLLSLLAFVVGAIGVFLTTVFGTLIYWDLAGISDRDGGGAMGLIFVIGPLAGLIGGVISAAIVGFRLRKAGGARSNAQPMSRGKRLSLAVGSAALFGYCLGSFATWVLIGPVTETLFLAVVAVASPFVLAILGGVVAYRRVAASERSGENRPTQTDKEERK